ncbi:MAG TPA: hypothetical protein VI997_03675 [Candidatus Thermoplasmatota archaeon]|nr:hypothetical protein [Candidatus Thermoplasmatota archaeon]
MSTHRKVPFALSYVILLATLVPALMSPASAAATFVVEPQSPTLKETSPGVSTTLAFVVRNTGDASGDVTFVTGAAPAGWGVVLSSTAATIAAGGSTTVTATVTPSGVAVLEAPIVLEVRDGATVLASGVATVRVPVFLSAFTRDTQDGDTNNPQIRGTITAKFANGASATGVTVVFDEWKAVAASGLVNRETPYFSAGDFRRVSGTVGASGTAAYAFPVNNLGANSPGYHRIVASAAGVVNEGSSIDLVYFTHPVE